MQQAPVLALPSGVNTPNASGNSSSSSLSGFVSSDGGVKFFSAFSQAVQSLLEGHSQIPTGSVTADTLTKAFPLPGGTIDANLFALSQSSSLFVVDAADVEKLPLLGENTFPGGIPVTNDPVAPLALSQTWGETASDLQFQVPLELLQQVIAQDLGTGVPILPASAQEPEPEIANPKSLLKELEQAGFFVSTMTGVPSPGLGDAAEVTTSKPQGIPSGLQSLDPSLSRGLLSGGELLSTNSAKAVANNPTLANSLLAKGGRLNVPRSVLGRFQETRLAEMATTNPSMLTDSEKAAVNVSPEDRNATVLARLDRVEFVSRISQALERAKAQSPKSVELELNPPSLGKLRLQVMEIDGQLTARIQADSASARALLLEHMPVLDRNLGDQGIQMQRVQVEPPSGGDTSLSGGHNPQHSGGQHPRQQHEGTPLKWFTSAEDGENGKPLTISELLALAPGMDRLI
ncbi:MAG: flagellar hook-length control protein FliK [Planctomycetota bacterium]